MIAFIMATFAARGIRLEPRGDRLALVAPRPGMVCPEDVSAVRAHKPALLAALAPPVFRTHLAPVALPWRATLARWPDDWRERWGRRANALAESGSTWPEDERIAFAEVSAAMTLSP